MDISKTYKIELEETKELLGELQRILEERTAVTDLSWGDVGDVSHINTFLAHAVEFSDGPQGHR